MSAATDYLIKAAEHAADTLDGYERRNLSAWLREAIDGVKNELDPPFTVHKVVKTVAADDREVDETKGFR
jgi:hypothetical protein